MADARHSLPPGYQGKNGPEPPALPHIEDLLAIPKDIDANQSIKRLLDLAEASLRQSEMSRDFNRPALALKEYIRASIIAVQVVSNHKDYPALRNGQGGAGRAHNALLKRISQQSEVYEKIKRDIIQDNKRSGVQPSSGRPAPPSVPKARPINGAAASTPSQTTANGHAKPLANGSPAKKKPAVHPKPQSLHGNAIQPPGHGRAASTSSVSLDLNARFANLAGPQSSPGQDPRIKTYPIPTPKPAGPREMPTSPDRSVDTDAAAAALPKVPDAIYSPARGSVCGEAARLPSSTPRGLFSRTESSASLNGVSQQRSNDYVPPVPKPVVPEETEEQMQLPEGDTITAEQLYEAMKSQGSILIIDVRSREDFNEGHIMSSTIICIEPSILLRDNISSEEISESMVLSPGHEQPLFEKRDKYDLIVFYDQDSEQIAQSPRNADELVVVSLHRALVHLNYGRDLKTPPRLLKGGLGAWVNLMGPRALQQSATTSTTASSRTALVRQTRQNVVQRKGSKYIITSLQPADVKAWQTTLEKDAHQTARRPNFPRTREELLRFPPVSTEQQTMAPAAVVENGHQVGLMQKFESPTQLPAPPARPRAAVQRPSYSSLFRGDDDGEAYGESGVTSTQRTAGGRLKKATAEQAPGAVAAKVYTGLNNPRNWCYANSVLQSLLASPEFGRELADSEWLTKYKVPRKAGEKIDPPQLMIQIISNLFHWMSTGQLETMKAQTLMEYSRYLCKSSDPQSQFGGSEQQDAQEFMSFMMEQLHDETNPRRDRSGKVEQPKTKGRPLVQAAMEYWRNHSELNQSIVDRYWRGVELSTVKCSECDTRTHTFSPFGWVPIPVHRRRDMTITEALEVYTAENELDDFACDHCGGRRKATQSMSFARMPALLCLSFRRFDYDGRDFSKSNTAISWDFHDVDFTPFTVDAPAAAAADAAAAGAGPPHHDRAFAGPFRYECYAVVVHTGRQLSTGHYLAYVRDAGSRDPDAWYRCNDAVVAKVRIGGSQPGDLAKDVFRSGADRVPYLVFFRRKDA